MFFDTPVQAIGTVSLAMVCSYAVWRGGRPERLAAILVALDWFATPFFENHDAFKHPQFAVLALDGAVMVALLCIALTSDRYWPLWVTAFQLFELLMHVAMATDHRVRPRAYYIGIEIGSYLMLAALALGAWLEAPRRPAPPTAVSL
jgi:hypothetical protein